MFTELTAIGWNSKPAIKKTARLVAQPGWLQLRVCVRLVKQKLTLDVSCRDAET